MMNALKVRHSFFLKDYKHLNLFFTTWASTSVELHYLSYVNL